MRSIAAVGVLSVAATGVALAGFIGTLATTTKVATTTAAGPITSETTAAPAPIAGEGYTKVFDDEFEALDPANWLSTWWQPAPPPDTEYAANGLLHLVSMRRDGFPNVGIDTRGSCEDCADAHYFAPPMYVESRIRIPKGSGAWPSLWMSSSAHMWSHRAPCPTLNAEIDIFEGWHAAVNDAHTFLPALHRNAGDWCGLADTKSSWTPFDAGLDLSLAFHVFSVLVTATQVKFFLDGRPVTTLPVYDSTSQHYGLYISSWACNAGETCAGWHDWTNAYTPDLDMQVDWLRVWADPATDGAAG
jgi:hypothetical protein